MPKYAKPEITIRTPDSIDLAYAAGLIDGEGCLFAYPRGATGIQVCMTDIEPVEWLHEKFSGNLRSLDRKDGNKVNHTWSLQRQADLLFLLPLLRPYFKVKHRAADALLSYLHHIQEKPSGAESRNKAAPYFIERQRLLDALVATR